MQFGTATCSIVPPFPTSMGGYGVRLEHFRGVNDPLQFTALLLEENGRLALIGTADLINWPNDGTTERLTRQVAKELGIGPEQVLLNASHTHGGPKVPGLGLSGQRGDIASARRFADWLCEQVIETVRQARASMRPGTLHLHRGETALAINRRLARDGEILNAPNADGPVDNLLQVLSIRDADHRLAVVAARASCHPVATGAQYLLTADFVGAWRSATRALLGDDVQVMFLQGAGGDLRPRAAADGDEWRMLRHDELPAIGRALADETLQAMRMGDPVAPLILRGHIATVPAACRPLYTTPAQLESLLAHPRKAERDYARACLDLIAAGEPIPTSVDFRVQTLWLSHDLAMVGVNCELLHAVGQSLAEQMKPAEALVLGYTGGCLCYAPDTKELARGGYEAESYLYEMWSGPWAEGFEKTLAAGVAPRPAG